jgi:hypothetical protein
MIVEIPEPSSPVLGSEIWKVQKYWKLNVAHVFLNLGSACSFMQKQRVEN